MTNTKEHPPSPYFSLTPISDRAKKGLQIQISNPIGFQAFKNTISQHHKSHN